MTAAPSPMLCPSCGQQYAVGAFCAVDGTPLVKAGGGSSLEGRVIADRYRLTKLLGQGGMGQVYAAEHLHIAKKFAIKLLRPEIMTSPDAVVRFRQEAWAASSIGHENIIEIEDFATLPDGTVYLAMELLDGESLADRMKRAPVPIGEGLAITRQVCAGLRAAHDKGIVHRDLKPENLFLLRRTPAMLKILDFGIAKVFGGNEPSVQTRTGQIFGTPQYMSPEQACGKTPGPATDVYSLGVILYELLSGRVPFVGESTLQVLTQHLTAVPPALATVAPDRAFAPELERLVLAMMAKEPSERPTIAQVSEALAALESGASPEAFAATLGAPSQNLAAARPPSGNFGAARPPSGNFGAARPPSGNVGAARPPSGNFGAAQSPSGNFGAAAGAALPTGDVGAGLDRDAATGSGAPVAGKKRRGAWIALALVGAAAAAAGVFAILRMNATPTPAQPATPPPATATAAPPPIDSTKAPAAATPPSAAATPVDVVVDSIPVGAHILLDGKSIGVTPEVVKVAPGATEHVVLRKEGFADHSVTVDPTAGNKLVVKLQRNEPPRPAHAARETAAPPDHAAVAHAPAAPPDAVRDPYSQPSPVRDPYAAREPAPRTEPPRASHSADPLTQRIDAEARVAAPGARRVQTFQGAGPRTDWFVQLEGNRCYTFVATVESGGLYLYLWGPGGRRITDHRARTNVSTMTHCTQFPGSYRLQGKLAGGAGAYKLSVYLR